MEMLIKTMNFSYLIEEILTVGSQVSFKLNYAFDNRNGGNIKALVHHNNLNNSRHYC